MLFSEGAALPHEAMFRCRRGTRACCVLPRNERSHEPNSRRWNHYDACSDVRTRGFQAGTAQHGGSFHPDRRTIRQPGGRLFAPTLQKDAHTPERVLGS